MSWLIDQAILLSAITLALITISPLTNKFIGAAASYKLWTLVPVSLVLSPVLSKFSLSFYRQLHQVPAVKASLYEIATQHKQLTDLLVQNEALSLAGALWFSVAVILLSIFGAQNLNLYRLVNSLKEEKKYKVRLTVKTSEFHHSPFVTGLFKPTIVLPKDFETRYSQEQQALILKHEETHFQQGDLLWNLLANLFVIVFWFNPILWLAYRRFRQQQELSCDEKTTISCNEQNRLKYAKAILSSLWSQDKNTESAHVFRPSLTTHYGEKSSLKDRLLFLKERKNYSKSRVILTLSAITVAILLSFTSYHLVLEQAQSQLTAIKQVPPNYPPHAADKGIEGYVTLSFSVMENGKTQNIKVVESSHDTLFHDSAIKALKQWRYESPKQRMDDIMIRLDFALPKQVEAPLS